MATSWTKVALCIGAAGLLAGCDGKILDMNAAPVATPNKIRLEEGHVYEELATAEVTTPMLRGLGAEHARAGSGPIELMVTYPPKTSRAAAEARAQEMEHDLRRGGAQSVHTTILPVSDPRGSVAVLSFTTLKALGPEDCTPMPGTLGNGSQLDREYAIGCEGRTLLAKQIARPGDLQGRAGMSSADGQRAGMALEPYRMNEKVEQVEAESASD